MPELDVSPERLAALLGQHAESASLEFMEDCDLDERRDIVEFATETGAMGARGGSIVVGVDDHGRATGRLDDRRARLFDEATLRDKLGRYLPVSLPLRVGRHQAEAGPIVLVEVGAHHDGAVVFLADGTFEGVDKKQHIAFRRGEFFVRHGTKSELPNQDDVRRLREDAVARERVWLEELHRVQVAVDEVAGAAQQEAGDNPSMAVVGFGVPTRVPAARMRLAGCLDSLERLGGPQLPACRDLAQGSRFVYLFQLISEAHSATAEIARALAEGP